MTPALLAHISLRQAVQINGAVDTFVQFMERLIPGAAPTLIPWATPLCCLQFYLQRVPIGFVADHIVHREDGALVLLLVLGV